MIMERYAWAAEGNKQDNRSNDRRGRRQIWFQGRLSSGMKEDYGATARVYRCTVATSRHWVWYFRRAALCVVVSVVETGRALQQCFNEQPRYRADGVLHS